MNSTLGGRTEKKTTICARRDPISSRPLGVPAPSEENRRRKDFIFYECSLSPSEDQQLHPSALRMHGNCQRGREAYSFPRPSHLSLRRGGSELVLSFLRSDGLNSDPNHVFTVEKGVVHVCGNEFGFFITKEEYKNYYLRAEFKWGGGTFAPRQGQARESGILYNIQGPIMCGRARSSFRSTKAARAISG